MEAMHSKLCNTMNIWASFNDATTKIRHLFGSNTT